MKKPSFMNQSSIFQGVNSLHIGLLGVMGLFFAFQVVKLIYTMATGTESMSLPSAIVLCIVMGLLSAASLLLALTMWRQGQASDQKDDPDTES